MARVRDFIASSSDAAFAVSDDLRVLAWNRMAEAVFGLAAADALGRRCGDVVLAELPSGAPLCGPDCHGGVCFRNRVPFGIGDCLVPGSDGTPVRIRMNSLVVPGDGDGDAPRTRALVFVHQIGDTGAHAPLPLPLHIRMLGRFSVSLDERPVPVATWPRKAAVTVLKILAIERDHLVARDRLIEYLWPDVDEKRGRERLKVAVYSLRQLLAPADLVVHADEAYGLRPGAVLLDVAVFEQRVTEGIRHARQQRFDRAVASLGDALRLYRGDCLEEDAYEDWCAEARMRLRERYFEAAEYLARALIGQRRFDAAGRVCDGTLVRESCREVFHRMAIECLLAEGRVEEAERQYRRCRAALARELGVEPLPETRRLAARIGAARAARA